MGNKYSEFEILFIKNNYQKLSAKQIADSLNRPLSSIQDKISTLNLKKEKCSNAKWDEDEIEFLKNNYESKSYDEMSKYLNRTEKSIKIKAHKLGLKKSGIYYSHNKFKEILTEEDAYWLGFLYADGYVVESTHSYFGIELQGSDDNHLRKFNKFMNGNAAIYYRDRKSPHSENCFTVCSIMFSGKDLVENLKNKGCVPNKSFIIEFPEFIEGDLMRHFIRGYFDGNGSLGKYNKGRYLRATISCASYNFVASFKKYLEKLEISSSIYKDKNCYKLYIVGKDCPKNFLKYIYNDSNIYMDRKYKQYLNLCA